MKRNIIKIDESKCNGCGLCMPNCPEGAIQIIDSKARLISDLFCDGLGACLGHCPEHAIQIEEREAEDYDEYKVMENIVKQGENVVRAHLIHLNEHGETELLSQAKDYLKQNGINISIGKGKQKSEHQHSGCPGARMMELSNIENSDADESGKRHSCLKQWPIQFHLVSPTAPYYKGADLLLSADCVAYSLGDFHKDYLKGRSLAIACPKLDENKEAYAEKLMIMIEKSLIKSITVLTMEVPCCQGLLSMAIHTAKNSSRKVPIKSIIVGINGEIKSEESVEAAVKLNN